MVDRDVRLNQRQAMDLLKTGKGTFDELVRRGLITPATERLVPGKNGQNRRVATYHLSQLQSVSPEEIATIRNAKTGRVGQKAIQAVKLQSRLQALEEKVDRMLGLLAPSTIVNEGQ
jgi:hypothetical protein